MDETSHDEMSIRREVIRAARRMLQLGYVSGTAGNISARLGASPKLVITPSNTPYANLEPDDLALCTVDCEHLSGSIHPSIELPLHAAIYCSRLDALAIVHTHSPHALAVAQTCEHLPVQPKAARQAIGSAIVVCVPYAPEGSQQLAEKAVAALGRDCKALLLAEHGTLAIGSSLQEAFTISEMIEEAAASFARPTQGST
jgi:L-fuculose-phosphate aldolase